MPFLERSRQTQQLTPGHRGDAPADGEHLVVGPTDHSVAEAPVHRALEGRVSAVGPAESEAPRRLVEVEFESFGCFVEPVSETT